PMTPSNTPASSDPATTQPDNTTPGATSGNVATVKVNGRSFEFQLAFCSMSGEDLLLHGPGKETGKDMPIYLEGDMTAKDRGEIRFDFGATGKFQSKDEFYVIGAPEPGSTSLVADGDGYLITGAARDGQGNSLGQGEIRFSCK
ncbi:MAG: hypothetical protein WBA28_07165, partial [Microbacteriaceae bacterium]